MTDTDHIVAVMRIPPQPVTAVRGGLRYLKLVGHIRADGITVPDTAGQITVFQIEICRRMKHVSGAVVIAEIGVQRNKRGEIHRIVAACQTELFKIVDAAGGSAALSRGIKSRKQYRCQNGDDGDDDQKFDQSKPHAVYSHP